ncbi:hypothetical protein DXG01_008232 [Tephrocybe rancida]|nr:hypothetical protein DXG01_008232 [Tephrocybe rancida]
MVLHDDPKHNRKDEGGELGRPQVGESPKQLQNHVEQRGQPRHNADPRTTPAGPTPSTPNATHTHTGPTQPPERRQHDTLEPQAPPRCTSHTAPRATHLPAAHPPAARM